MNNDHNLESEVDFKCGMLPYHSGVFSSEIHRTAHRLCETCESPSCARLAHNSCSHCFKRICNVCKVDSAALPYDTFCSDSCAEDAEIEALAAKAAGEER